MSRSSAGPVSLSRLTAWPSRSSPTSALLFALGLGACSAGGDSVCDGDDCSSVQGSSSEADQDGGAKSSVSPKRDAASANLPKSATGPNVPCDVQPLIDKYCSTCHGAPAAFGAPMSLVSASDFQAKSTVSGTALTSLVDQRLNASRNAMPPQGQPQPSAAERALITSWVEAGALGSSDKCDATQPSKADAGIVDMVPTTSDENLDCYQLTAHADGDLTKPFAVGVAKDAYYNFTFAPPWTGTVYGITVKPVIGNMQAIHHWLLFEDDTPGVPSGGVHEVGAHPGGQLLFGWAPGGVPFDFRQTGADVGVELPPTTYTIEFHYNSTDAAATDASGVEICVQKNKPANIAGLSWLGNDNLLFPSAEWTGTCAPLSTEPIHILSVTPHMHLQGIHMKGTINRKDGTKEILHDEPFDFNYQTLYPKDVTLNPGDTITTVCDYAKPMSFGESTTAEMCYLFTMAYPKGALASADLWGTFAHGGSSCLGQ